jgi:lysophospholipase L1-like esterase
LTALACAGQTPVKKKKKPVVHKKTAAKKATGTRRHPAAKPLKPLPPPEPIHVGIENGAEALAPFYQALGDRSQVVRILHFGDSHVAADIWTRHLRNAFQQRYGDAGPGLVLPGAVFRGYRRAGVVVKAPIKSWQGLTLRNAPEDGLLGLPGAALNGKINAPAAIASARFSNFELEIAGDADDCASITIDDGETPLDREQIVGTYGTLTFVRNHEPLPLAPHTLQVPGCGSVSRIVGLDLRSGLPGVIYDAFGINGAQFADQDKLSAPLRKDLLARLNPTLLVVSFGTNEMGRKGLEAGAYKAECVRLLRALRADAGAAPVLMTGPPDRPGRTLKSRQLFHERSDMVVGALKAAAAETGCAFWDARAAMGGFGAMLRWRRSSLAQPDLVHLSAPGYELLAKMLFDEIMAAAPPPQTK